ncbi:cob(I)yrinic acid a,c-diamide adenosyltransferase [Photobacterium sanguinicancri]|uniref:Corrinoid adenosyltransferase n=1 Tax=Photobacterium sanguinicancri TaxID=875932 RepID=A0AAW7Y155_9GAMM|nr:cob(I)yrinic acid a,c-diamide adenosyltransferase [Photobacterium sanguinicancri]MDO6542318.1 cob(I)yrinic acid a,c-diamide adenosyltransferase [Photobacterium sanguinicancri]
MLTIEEKNKLAQQTARHEVMKMKVHEKSDLAVDDKRRVLVLTGNGKGKTSSGFGMIFRALGHSQGCAVIQYLKGDAESGERNLLQQLGVPVVTMNTGCSFKEGYCAERERVRAREVWLQTLTFLNDPDIDVLLLDEVTYMVARKHLDVDEMIAAFEARPANQSVILTGRAVHRKLREYADTVSRVDCVKHGLQIGLKARKGIEF